MNLSYKTNKYSSLWKIRVYIGEFVRINDVSLRIIDMRRLVFYGCFFLLVWNVSLIYAQDKEIVRQALACKDYDRVIEETNRADTLDAECREWRLQAFRALGRWTDVRNLLEEALAADTTQAGVYADLADCYRQQGNEAVSK